MHDEQIRAAKRVNDSIIDFLSFFYGVNGVSDAENLLAESEALNDEEMADVQEELLRVVLEELEYIRIVLAKEFFYLKGTEIYDAYLSYLTDVIYPAFNAWVDGEYVIDEHEEDYQINLDMLYDMIGDHIGADQLLE